MENRRKRNGIIRLFRASTRKTVAGMALLTLFLMTSCIYDGPGESLEQTTDLTFTFRLSQDQLATNTRSNPPCWDDIYTSSDATLWESTMKTIAVHAYKKSDGSYLGSFTDMVQTGTDIYQAHIKKQNGEYVNGEDIAGSTLRFHVFVNDLPLAPPSSESDLFQMSEKSCYNNGNFSLSYIPMWGLQEQTINWSAGNKKEINLGTVNLLRSLAKVEIEITSSDDDDDYDYLDEITFSGKRAKSFFHVPRYDEDGDYAVKGISETKKLNQYYSGFQDEAEPLSEKLVFYPLPGDNKKAIFYIPEQPNNATDEVTLTLKCGGETFSSSPLKFRTYEDGKATGDPYNILRNHHYKYEVTIRKGLLLIKSKDWEHSFDNDFDF